MDHQLACVNVHWVSLPTEGGLNSFHVEGLSQHLLNDAHGIRAVQRAVKNILDHFGDTRLRTLCQALDAYREKVAREREAVTTNRDQGHAVQTEPRRRGRPKRQPSPIQRQKSRRRPELVETTTPPEEDWTDRPLEKQYCGRGSRSIRGTARRGRGEQTSPERRNRTNFSLTATRTASRGASTRAARVVDTTDSHAVSAASLFTCGGFLTIDKKGGRAWTDINIA